MQIEYCIGAEELHFTDIFDIFPIFPLFPTFFLFSCSIFVIKAVRHKNRKQRVRLQKIENRRQKITKLQACLELKNEDGLNALHTFLMKLLPII